MNRKGEVDPVKLVIGIVIAIFVAAFIFYFVTGGFKSLKNFTTCTYGGQGFCAQKCGDEGELQTHLILGCGEGYVCCKSKDAAFGSTASGGQSSQVNAVASVSAPAISMSYLSKTPVSTKQTITVQPDDEQQLVLTIKTTSNTDKDCKDKAKAENGALCSTNWTKEVIVEDYNHNILYTWTTMQGPSPFKAAGPNEELRTMSSEELKNDNRHVLKVYPQKPGAAATKNNIVETTSYYLVVPQFNYSYIGQTLHMTVNVYPGTDTGLRPELESHYDLYFKVYSGLTYSGLEPVWSKSKTITVTCDKKYMSCSKIYYMYVDDACPAPTDVAANLTQDKLDQFGAPKIIQPEVKKYCLTVGTKQQDCYNSQGECQQQLDQLRASEETTAAFKAFEDALLKNEQITEGMYVDFGNAQTKLDATKCTPYNVYTVNSILKNQLYVANNFNLAGSPTGPTASFLLNQGVLADKNLCVYAQDGVKKLPSGAPRVYSAGIGKKILVDVIPPTVEVHFKPWKKRLSFICIDNQSGCVDTIGTSYISDVTKYLPALFSTPQSASDYCPQNAASYEPRYSMETTYTSNEIRVLCVRGEDRAGNAAYSMITVYDSYEALAMALAAAKK